MMGLYLYASGAQKQTIGVLSHFGITESYSNLVRNAEQGSSAPGPPLETPHTPEQTVNLLNLSTLSGTPTASSTSIRNSNPAPSRIDFCGTLQKLCSSVWQKAHSIATTGLFAEVYDNINFLSRTGEQAVGHHGAYIFLPADSQCY